jgi:hypothetical protein
MRRFFEWIVDHPYLTIGVILLITLGFLAFIPRLRVDTDFSHYIDKSDPTVAAMERAEDRYGSQELFLVAVENKNGIFNRETLEKISAMQEAFEGLRGVDEVTGPLNAQVITGTVTTLAVGPAAVGEAVPETPEEMETYRERVMASNTVRDYIVSSDGKAAVISIKLKMDADEVEIAKEVAMIVEEYNTPPDRIYIIGLPYMNLVLAESMGKDLKILIPLVILMIVLVLYLGFQTLRGVVLPLLVVSFSVVWSLGLMAIFNAPVTIISFVLPVILMAIGIADGIHILNRYNEETAKGLLKREAILKTLKEMRGAVVMTSLTTMGGFLALLNSYLIPQRQFGLFTAVGVLVAMILSLVLIPALLAVLRVPRGKLHGKTDGILTRTLSGFERVILSHRRIVLVGSVVLFLAFLAGLPLLKIETSQVEYLGEKNPVMQAIDVMDRRFSGSEQMMVEIDTGKRDGLKDPVVLNKIVALQEFLKEKGVRKTTSLADMVREMNQKFHADDPTYYVIPQDRKLVSQLLLLFTFQGGNLGSMALGDFSAGEVMGLYTMEGSAKQVQLVQEVQAYLDEHFTGAIRAEMVGPAQVQSSLYSRIAKSQITSLGSSILAAGLIVTLLMGSVVAGSISLIPLVLTVVISFGVMAYSGTPLNMATLMVSSITIGIGIDYGIHFISRFRQEVRMGKEEGQALQATIQTTGRGIAYNALALALGFGVLIFSSFKGMSSFGLLIAMAMVISALSAFTVIPAILVTFKPRFLTRIKQAGKGRQEKGDR